MKRILGLAFACVATVGAFAFFNLFEAAPLPARAILVGGGFLAFLHASIMATSINPAKVAVKDGAFSGALLMVTIYVLIAMISTFGAGSEVEPPQLAQMLRDALTMAGSGAVAGLCYVLASRTVDMGIAYYEKKGGE